ncbi:SpdA protein [Streptomyces umbrinus]|uniref:SpdA protein n=1 Tax=Streptomyces umbrinus TaxID=67370 RepID=UPI00342FBEB4
MTTPSPQHTSTPPASSFERDFTLRAVTALMTAVVGLTFLFGFGNVWALARHLGVTPWVAPLVAPAVDLSVIGLLLGTRYLALHGARPAQLRPARRLLLFSSLITLALNTTEPLLAGHHAKAAFDAVGPLLLIGWAEVGPDLLQAITTTANKEREAPEPQAKPSGPPAATAGAPAKTDAQPPDTPTSSNPHVPHAEKGDLLERARREDTQHWHEHQRPISAETLRKRLSIGAARSRMLVAILRNDTSRNQTIREG